MNDGERLSTSSFRPAATARPNEGILTVALAPTRRRTLSEEVASQLLEQIAADEGDEVRLPSERNLAEMMGVSRASLREALSALNELGVIETRGKAKYAEPQRARAALVGRGAARSSERALVTDPIEVRRMLEPEVAARAAERMTPRALAELESWVRLGEESAERDEPIFEYDSAFHVSIARATGNQTLLHLVAALMDSLRESRERSFEPQEAVATALADHRAIVAALASGDANAARKAMRSHIDHVEALIRRSLEGQPYATEQAR
jgi:GntR family transcriptional regulator, transcriptional repressor for pyruvate dehydrogenase complex